MAKRSKVNIFLLFVAFVAIIIAIFALTRTESPSVPVYTEKEYNESMQCLIDTIKTLKGEIAKYQEDIDRIELDRQAMRKELEQILKDHEKTDSELANGDWDGNIRFITDYLSKKDSDRK